MLGPVHPPPTTSAPAPSTTHPASSRPFVAKLAAAGPAAAALLLLQPKQVDAQADAGPRGGPCKSTAADPMSLAVADPLRLAVADPLRLAVAGGLPAPPLPPQQQQLCLPPYGPLPAASRRLPGLAAPCGHRGSPRGDDAAPPSAQVEAQLSAESSEGGPPGPCGMVWGGPEGHGEGGALRVGPEGHGGGPLRVEGGARWSLVHQYSVPGCSAQAVAAALAAHGHSIL